MFYRNQYRALILIKYFLSKSKIFDFNKINSEQSYSPIMLFVLCDLHKIIENRTRYADSMPYKHTIRMFDFRPLNCTSALV